MLIRDLCTWLLVFSMTTLSAVENKDPTTPDHRIVAPETGDKGDAVLDGLVEEPSITLTPSSFGKTLEPSESEKRSDAFIRGAFCMVTFLLFTAGYIGTKSHRGKRVSTGINAGETIGAGGLCGRR